MEYEEQELSTQIIVIGSESIQDSTHRTEGEKTEYLSDQEELRAAVDKLPGGPRIDAIRIHAATEKLKQEYDVAELKSKIDLLNQENVGLQIKYEVLEKSHKEHVNLIERGCAEKMELLERAYAEKAALLERASAERERAYAEKLAEKMELLERAYAEKLALLERASAEQERAYADKGALLEQLYKAYENNFQNKASQVVFKKAVTFVAQLLDESMKLDDDKCDVVNKA